MLCHIHETYEGELNGGAIKGRITTAIDGKEPCVRVSDSIAHDLKRHIKLEYAQTGNSPNVPRWAKVTGLGNYVEHL